MWLWVFMYKDVICASVCGAYSVYARVICPSPLYKHIYRAKHSNALNYMNGIKCSQRYVAQRARASTSCNSIGILPHRFLSAFLNNKVWRKIMKQKSITNQTHRQSERNHFFRVCVLKKFEHRLIDDRPIRVSLSPQENFLHCFSIR